MTPKLRRFLDEVRPATPCLVLDLDRVEANYGALRAALPDVALFYAVKANPAAPVLERLARLGASFDAASRREIEAVLAAGAAPDRISFGNTIKKEADIAWAYARACACSRSTARSSSRRSPARRREALSSAAS